MPNSDHEFERMDDLWFDPEFRDFLDGPVESVQEELDTMANKSDDEILSSVADLNEMWEDEYRWEDSTATISGKIRLRDLDDKDELMDQILSLCASENLDESGEFYKVEHLPVVLADFVVQCDKDGNFEDHIGLSLHLQNDYDEFADSEMSGNFMMYPEDIDAITMDMPSMRAIETQLQWEYPELLSRITQNIPDQYIRPQKIIERMRNIHFYANEIDDSDELKNQLELVMYALCDFGVKPYDMNVSNYVYTKDIDGSLLMSEKIDQLAKIRGQICGVELLPDDEISYKPALIVVEKQFDGADAGRYLQYLVPVDNIKKIRNESASAIKFARSVDLLMTHADPEEILLEKIRTAGERSAEKSADETTEFDAIVADFPEISVDKVTSEVFRAVDSELEEIRQAYSDQISAIQEAEDGVALSPDDLDIIDDNIAQKHIPKLEFLKPGSCVKAGGHGVVSVPSSEDENLYQDIALDDETQIKGVLKGVSAVDMTENGSNEDQRIAFALLLDECTIPAVDQPVDGVYLICSLPYLPHIEVRI